MLVSLADFRASGYRALTRYMSHYAANVDPTRTRRPLLNLCVPGKRRVELYTQDGWCIEAYHERDR